MTTCMRLYLAHQSDFYAFTKAPRTLGIWLHSPHPSREVSLQDAWQDLDALLSSSAVPSPLRPAAADWTYPTAADQGGHAISAASAERLLHSIQVGPEPHGLAYFPQPGRFSIGHNGVYR